MNALDRIGKYRQTGPSHANMVMTALRIIGEDDFLKKLNEAEALGKRLELTYPIAFERGPSEPNGVKIS